VTSPLRILHLEDNVNDAELIQAAVESAGIRVRVTRVETQADFVASLDRGGFDIILSDYTLPSFDGLSALKIALEKCPDVPFIFVSGTLGEEVAIEALKIGATDYLLKDRLSRIPASVHRALREANERGERRRAEALLAGEKRLLEMIAKGDTLAMILDALCRLVEEQSPTCLSSILLLDPDGTRLWHGAAPSLPRSYMDAIDGSTIGPAAGSCGTAAYLKVPVVVSDIAHDRLWAEYRDLALPHGLRACWSTPIIASDGRVLGTFAMYAREPGRPTPQQQNIIEQITDLASIAIERKRAEEQRQAHLWFLESMDRVNRAIQGTNDLEQMMSDVLEAVLSVFECDRAWLVYPCDPEAVSNGVKMQRTRPEFPGLYAIGADVPVDAETADLFRTVRASSGPVALGPGSQYPLSAKMAKRLGIQSRIVMALYPKGDQPYMFGLSQCSYPRAWTPQEERLFQEIGRRLEDALTSLLIFRNLGASERSLEEAQRISHVGYWERDLATNRYTWSDETYRIFGVQPQERVFSFDEVSEFLHPADRQKRAAAVAEALGAGPRYDVEYRVVRPNGEVRFVRSEGDVVRDGSGRPRRIFGTLQDITERKRAEHRLVAQHTVTQILAEAATLEEATPKVLRAVCECLVWDVGVLWRRDREAGVLRCVEIWHKESIEAPEFETASRESTFEPGRGLPGRVWSSREPAYISDVVQDENFPRAAIAARDALHAAFGFPILLVDELLGVMEFFSHEIRQPDQDLLEMMANIGSQVGQFIERKQAEDVSRHDEEQLRKSEERFRAVFENSAVGIVLQSGDRSGRFLAANAAYQRMLGYSAEELSTRTFMDITYEEDREANRRLAVELLEGKRQSFELVKRNRRKDGTLMWVSIHVSLIPGTGSNDQMFMSIVDDITERKRAEEALGRSERQFRALFEEAAVGIALVDSAGRPFESNRKLQEILGYSAHEFGGMPFTAFTYPEDAMADWSLFSDLLSGKRDHYHIEKRYRRKDGTLVWGDLTVYIVRDDRGQPMFSIGMVQDITDRKRAEEALQKAQAELAHVARVSTLGELAASIAHEISQPLAAAVADANACLNWLAADPPDIDSVREALAGVVTDSHRAAEVIGRIRALCKRTDPQRERLDINDVIREVVLLARHEVLGHRVALRTDLASALPAVLGDRVQLQQVMINLVMNGMEAMAPITDRPRELLIRSQHEADQVLVAVQDSGPGIDADNVDRMFDAFFTTKPSGMGMGLSISRSIVEAHGGRLWASPNTGPGATFQFSLTTDSKSDA